MSSKKEYVKTLGDYLIPKTNDLVKLNDEYYIPKSVLIKALINDDKSNNKNKEDDFELEL